MDDPGRSLMRLEVLGWDSTFQIFLGWPTRGLEPITAWRSMPKTRRADHQESPATPVCNSL